MFMMWSLVKGSDIVACICLMTICKAFSDPLTIARIMWYFDLLNLNSLR